MGCFVGSESSRAFGINRQGACHRTSCTDERGDQSIPRFRLFVREDDDKPAIWHKSLNRLRERGNHSFLIPTPGCLTVSLRVGRVLNQLFTSRHHFISLEDLGIEITHGTAKPYIEEVREIGIRNGSVVRRIRDDGIDLQRSVRASSALMKHLRIPTCSRAEPRDGFHDQSQSGGVATRCVRRCGNLAKVPCHRKGVLGEGVRDKLAPWLPRTDGAVPVCSPREHTVEVPLDSLRQGGISCRPHNLTACLARPL